MWFVVFLEREVDILWFLLFLFCLGLYCRGKSFSFSIAMNLILHTDILILKIHLHHILTFTLFWGIMIRNKLILQCSHNFYSKLKVFYHHNYYFIIIFKNILLFDMQYQLVLFYTILCLIQAYCMNIINMYTSSYALHGNIRSEVTV